MQPEITDEQYRQLAIDEHVDEGTIEIDSNARVSRSETQDGELGAYVEAWVFVHRPPDRDISEPISDSDS